MLVTKFTSVLLLLVILTLVVLVQHTQAAVKPRDETGGGLCAGCVIVFRVVEQVIQYKEPNVEKALNYFCSLLPANFQTACSLIVKVEAPLLISMLQNKETPDVICQQLKVCKDKTCHLYPYNKNSNGESVMKYKVRVGEPWWKKVLDALLAPFMETFDKHKPLEDTDNDGFTVIEGFRGSMWRGRDCDNKNALTHPGRRYNNVTDDARVDNNCNGIAGVDPVTGRAYEDLLCSGTGQRGVAVLGDSASAHFRIPPQFVTADTINKETYSHLIKFLELEADWPHLSTVTGFANDTTGLTPGPNSSIYKMLRQRNRCMHRDYQSISVNGARSGAMQDIVKTLSRNKTGDHPLTVFYSLVGNDVCSPHKDFSFTTTEQFYKNVVGTLDYLETVLPANSFVVFVGLAQGGILYDILHDQYHPLGIKMYDFLNCLGSSPCWGWMNTNETIRDITSKQAEQLSLVYDQIIADKQGVYKQFKMAYHEFPLKDILKDYKGPLTDLIEPMDGFHPSQITESLIAEYMFNWLEQNYPEALGPINPNNDRIVRLFGEQGGY